MKSLWLLPGLSLCLAAQGPLVLRAPIQRVRLHPDEAWITRSGQLRVAAGGVHRLLLKDLPHGLVLEDLRVSARGPQGSRLGDLSVATESRKVTETLEYKALKAEWETLRDRQDALEAEGEALAQEQVFLRSLQAAYDKELSGRMTSVLPAPGPVVELSRGLQIRLGEVLTRDRRRKRDLEKGKEELQRIAAEMAQRSAERNASPSQVLVEVATPQAGEVVVEVTYRTRRARWEPGYEARLSQDGKKVELVLFATVRQGSGEDWSGVVLEVTNSRSSRSLTLARFAGPQLVSHQEEEAFRARLAPGAAAKAAFAPAPMMERNSAQNLLVTLDQEAPEAREPEAVPLEEAKGLAATWSLEGLKEVPADNEPHRFRVLAREVEPDLALVAVPRLDPTVYRVARFPVPAGIPVFPGAPMVHFAGTQRVGLAPLELPAPGKPFQVGFGPFRGMRVALQRLEARKEQVGAFTKETQWTLREAFEVANETTDTLTVELQDRELKSASDKVKITFTAEGAPTQEGPTPGVRAWSVKLEPKATAGIRMATLIRAPLGGEMNGLDNLHLPE